jgi:opacity protein-like surface antigen
MTTSPAGLVKVLALPLFVLALSTPAWSQEAPGAAKEGFYVGVSGQRGFTLDGVNFDGESYYKKIDGDEIIILPRLDKKDVLRGLAGYRAKHGSFEVSYDQTKHVGTFAGVPGVESTFHSVNFDERIYPVARYRVQPYALLGGSVPWMTIKDGGFLDPDFGDATFRGFGVNTEAGVAVFPTSRLGISAGYRYRAIWFDTAHGVSKTKYELRPRFHETSGSAVVTAFFAF